MGKLEVQVKNEHLWAAKKTNLQIEAKDISRN